MRFFRFSVFLLLLAQAFNLAANDFSAAASPQELTSRLRGILGEYQVPGLIGTLVDGDRVIWKGAIGIADRDAQIAVTRDSLFRLGSISSLVTSLTALRLVEADKLGLDAPVSQFLPLDLCENPWKDTAAVRLRDALANTAGYDDLSLAFFARDDAVSSAKPLDAIRFNPEACTSRWLPGSRFAYSDMGPVVAAAVMENVTGTAFEDIAASEVFEPLQMNTATFFPDENVAASYSRDGVMIPYQRYLNRPSVALNATWMDMAQLLKVLNRRGTLDHTPWLSSDSILQMETAQTTEAAARGLQAGYGLGNSLYQADGFVYRGHSGHIEGFSAMLAYLPELRRGFFFAINQQSPEAEALIRKELSAYLTRGLALQKTPVTATLSVEQLGQYSGFYFPVSAQREQFAGFNQLFFIESRAQDGNLLVRSPFFDDQIFQPVGDHQFANLGENAVLPDLIFLDNGKGGWNLQWQGVYYQPETAWQAWGQLALLLLAAVLVATSVLGGFLWLVVRLASVKKQRVKKIWLLPFLGSLLLVVASLFCLQALNVQALASLGALGGLSASIWFATVLIPFFAVWSLFSTLGKFFQRAQFGAWLWWHSLLVSVALCAVSFFLYDWGWIGLRTWLHP